MQRMFLLLLVCACGSADTLRLNSGRTVEGTYLGGDARNIRFDDGDRVRTYSVNDVSELRFGSTEPTNVAPQQQSANPVLSPAPTTPVRQSPSVPQRTTSSASGEIPEGTSLVLRMIDDVDSQRDTVGQTFRASIDEAVTIGERTVIPRGADVLVKLVDDKQAGRLSGKTELTLDVVSVMVNGRMVDVRTEEVSRASASRTGKTGQVVGGTAALGAIIGAIAGGGKGAAIGAVSGAAAGGAVQVLTRGERVRIPSETRLTFVLQQSLRI